MSITPEIIANVARLAKLQLDQSALDAYTKDLTKIIEMVDILQQVDTDGITPMSHPLSSAARVREDIVSEHNQRELMQSIAPETAKGLYLVPKVIK